MKSFEVLVAKLSESWIIRFADKDFYAILISAEQDYMHVEVVGVVVLAIPRSE